MGECNDLSFFPVLKPAHRTRTKLSLFYKFSDSKNHSTSSSSYIQNKKIKNKRSKFKVHVAPSRDVENDLHVG